MSKNLIYDLDNLENYEDNVTHFEKIKSRHENQERVKSKIRDKGKNHRIKKEDWNERWTDSYDFFEDCE